MNSVSEISAEVGVGGLFYKSLVSTIQVAGSNY